MIPRYRAKRLRWVEFATFHQKKQIQAPPISMYQSMQLKLENKMVSSAKQTELGQSGGT